MTDEDATPPGSQQIDLPDLQLTLGSSELRRDSAWIGQAIAMHLPANASNVDWSRNPTFGHGDPHQGLGYGYGDEGRTEVV